MTRDWKAIEDDEHPVGQMLGESHLSSGQFARGDAIELPNGELLVITRGGDRETALCVRGRYKRPTEIYT
jgi:hypothetical protein